MILFHPRIKSLLPSPDSLDAAFDAGRRQVLKQQLPGDSRRAVVAWLGGVRLARLRLLDVLAAHQVTRIPTVGQPTDPHTHLTVATGPSGTASDGVIISEVHAGDTAPGKVLRFAEVVVSRKQETKSRLPAQTPCHLEERSGEKSPV